MNWMKFLLNEFREDFLEAQEKGNPFHFTWLLFWIDFVGWK